MEKIWTKFHTFFLYYNIEKLLKVKTGGTLRCLSTKPQKEKARLETHPFQKIMKITLSITVYEILRKSMI